MVDVMSEEQVRAFCLALPGAREDIKWSDCRVFSIAGNKMFAVMNLAGNALSFKVDPELFLGHVDRPGIRPAPYLARAYWISLQAPYPIGGQELRELLRRSHQLVVARLPKLKRVGLLL